MKIGIIELLALHDAVNDTAEIYNLPIPVAPFQVFDDIRDYKKMGGLKKQLEKLSAQLYIAKQVCSNQYQAMTALADLQSYGLNFLPELEQLSSQKKYVMNNKIN